MGPTTSLSLVRAEDLLELGFELRNMRVEERAGGSVLVRVDQSAEARLIVTFPPQHVAEQAFVAGGPTRQPPVRARVAGSSRVAFVVPLGTNEIPLTLDGLLTWWGFTPALAANARPPNSSGPPVGPAEPPLDTTAIEAPYRLVLSTLRGGRWDHATLPVTHNGWTELWHTERVDGPVDTSGPGSGRVVRAIWSPDILSPVDGVGALSSQNRRDIVRLSGDFTTGPAPVPIATDPLMLSARGAWLELTGDWILLEPPLPELYDRDPRVALADFLDESGLASDPVAFVREQFLAEFIEPAPAEERLRLLRQILQRVSQDPADIGQFCRDWLAELPEPPVDRMEWRHQGTQGRDNVVRVTSPGFLFPFGHRVSRVTVTERVPGPAPDGSLTGYLRQRTYLEVTEPVKDYRPMLAAYQHDGREALFFTARIATGTTPELDPFPDAALAWPAVAGVDLTWHVICTDREGRVVDLSLPLLFVPAVDADGHRFDERAAAREYRGSPRRRVETGGQPIAFADARPTRPAEVVLATESITLDAEVVDDDGGTGIDQPLPDGQPRFLPTLASAVVRIPQVDTLLGSAAAAGTPIEFDGTYLAAGFDNARNKGQVFAALRRDGQRAPLRLGFDPKQVGGLARPDVTVDALSRVLGPVPDAGNLIQGVFAPERFLPDAKILGGIPLTQLLAPLRGGFTPQELPDLAGLDADALWQRLTADATPVKLPALTSHTLRDAAGVPTAVETRYVWKPAVISGPVPGATALSLAPGARLVLASTLRASLTGGAPTFDSHGELTDFAFDFADLVRVGLRRLAFTVTAGRKPDITAEGIDLTFLGDLEFVNEIRRYVPADGFSDPPAIAVTPDGIRAGYSLGLPRIGIGVFSLENLGLSAELTLPFVDAPARVRFALAERHDPFLVTVSLFGGGGFFALDVAADRTVAVEAAIEFGGNFSLDILVASGGVHVLAGVYLAMSGTGVELSGYLRAGGALTVIGLITISIEFYLALSYAETVSGRRKVWGEASLTVGVEVLFFSQSVTLHVRREFAGSAGDPTFEDLVQPNDWAAYCGSFAP